MSKDRDDESGKYTTTYPAIEFIDAIKTEDGVAGTGDIADLVGCSHRQALNRLKILEEENVVMSKDVGRSLIWQLTENSSTDDE